MNIVVLPRGELTAIAIAEALRWGKRPICPRCLSRRVYRVEARNGGREQHRRLRCRSCRKMFTVRTGTILEETRLPISTWFRYINTILNGDGNMFSASKRLGINYKTSRRIAKRLRLLRTT